MEHADEPDRPNVGKRLFGSTGRPAQWASVGHLASGLVLGTAVGAVLPPARGAVLAGLVAGAVAAVGAGVAPALAWQVARKAVVATAIGASLAYVTTGHRWWSAAAMAVVAVLTSLAAGTGPVGATMGMIGSFLSVLVAGLARIAGLYPGVTVASGLARIAAGSAVGLAIVAVSARFRARRADPVPPSVQPVRLPSLWPPMLASLRAFDASTRDGVRRAIPLALGMLLMGRAGGRDAFWVFLAAFVVLLPTGKPPLVVALARVLSTVVGVVLVGLVALAVPHALLVATGVVLLLVGMAYGKRYPVLAGAATAMGAILLAGAPTGEVGTWAGHRLADTVIGSAAALAATFLLWPRDAAEDDRPVSPLGA